MFVNHNARITDFLEYLSSPTINTHTHTHAHNSYMICIAHTIDRGCSTIFNHLLFCFPPFRIICSRSAIFQLHLISRLLFSLILLLYHRNFLVPMLRRDISSSIQARMRLVMCFCCRSKINYLNMDFKNFQTITADQNSE